MTALLPTRCPLLAQLQASTRGGSASPPTTLHTHLVGPKHLLVEGAVVHHSAPALVVQDQRLLLLTLALLAAAAAAAALPRGPIQFLARRCTGSLAGGAPALSSGAHRAR